MRITDIKSALKGGNQVKSTKTQKRSNIEFNENLSEVWYPHPGLKSRFIRTHFCWKKKRRTTSP